MQKISQRLLDIVNALPVKENSRVLEIGCGTGLAAKAIANRIENGYVLAVDRSAKAIEQARKNCEPEIEKEKIKFVQTKIEAFELPADEALFDFAFAVRVGALDGRHPEIEEEALRRIKKALKRSGKLFIDGGNPLREIRLQKT